MPTVTSDPNDGEANVASTSPQFSPVAGRRAKAVFVKPAHEAVSTLIHFDNVFPGPGKDVPG